MKVCFFKKLNTIFLLFIATMGPLKAHIPTPIEFFGLDKTKLPNYVERKLLDQIVIYLTPQEDESEDFSAIFIFKLCEKLQAQIQQNSEFIFNHRFDVMRESILMRLLCIERNSENKKIISENKFDANFSFIEIMYKSYLLTP